MALRNPFLSNGSVNTPLHQQSYCWRLCFLFCPCKLVIKKRIGATSLIESCQFSWAVQGRLRRDIAIIEWNWRISIVRSRCQGTAGAGAVVICEVRRLEVALCLLVVPSDVYKWSINPLTNSYLVYSHTHRNRNNVKGKSCPASIYDSNAELCGKPEIRE
jgi:hypothetical protein